MQDSSRTSRQKTCPDGPAESEDCHYASAAVASPLGAQDFPHTVWKIHQKLHDTIYARLLAEHIYLIICIAEFLKCLNSYLTIP